MPRRDTKFKTKVGIDIYNTLFSLYNVKKLGNSEMGKPQDTILHAVNQ